MLGRLSVAALLITLVGATGAPASAQADFGINDFDVTFHAEGGTTASQAGSHPFAFTTSLKVNSNDETPEGELKELFLDEIPGVVANPIAVPRCKSEDFERLSEGANDCPSSTAVGIFESAAGASGQWATTPVFNLVPPDGTVMRLGFRIADTANVIVDFELSKDPPYRLLATVADFPQAITLLAAKLQLWGVPANQAHDPFRGRCAALGGLCPAGAPQQPFMTLPTSCEGPQSTYYEVLSWEGAEADGSAVSHDGAKPPTPAGFTGCGRLSFGPSVDVEPTTEAAHSPSGLSLSIDVFDEGLGNPAGIAQSQIRDLVLALPEGMTINPKATNGLEYCSEAELDSEAPDSSSGEGCPVGATQGTVEVETPLAEGLLEGSIFAAEPSEENPDLPRLYAVAKAPELGVVVKQIVEIEQDPETGQLFFFAEELPELPLSHLALHLNEREGGLLLTPPRCGVYNGKDAAHEPIRSALTPWSGTSPLAISSSFEITSGPNGGPCPTDQGNTQPGATASCGSCQTPPPPDTAPPNTTIRKREIKARAHLAVFTFDSSESNSHFLCRLGREKAAPCISPKRYTHLEPGRNRFKVWAIDAAGNKDSTPAVARFRFPS